jgi:hypothetical protein
LRCRTGRNRRLAPSYVHLSVGNESIPVAHVVGAPRDNCQPIRTLALRPGGRRTRAEGMLHCRLAVTSITQPALTSPCLVSVVVATRNRPELLRECLQAVADQTHQAVEVLVVDDGSDTATREAYRTLCPALEGRLRWLLPEYPDAPGTGPGAARNRGINSASGQYLAFCDDDDKWIRSDHLACGVRALESSGADFFFANVVATRGGEPSGHVWFPRHDFLTRGASVIDDAGVFAADLTSVLRVVAGTVIHPDCWVVRKSVVQDVGGFWERLWFSEDYDLMMRVLDRVPLILYRPEPCVDYRLPVGDSVSLRSSPLETLLQEIMAAKHVQLMSKRAVVRRHARAREAWGLRQLARDCRRSGETRLGRALAWQALCTYPTFGALSEVFRARTDAGRRPDVGHRAQATTGDPSDER